MPRIPRTVRATRAGILALSLALAACVAAPKPDSPELAIFAHKELAAGRADAALAHAEARLKAEPRDANAVLVRGLALNRLGRHAAAASVFEDYIARGGNNRGVVVEYAWSLLATGEADDAAALLEGYLRADPNAGAAHLLLGEAYLAKNQPAKAEAALKRALADKALRPRALLGLVALEAARGDGKAVLAHAIDLMRNEPRSPEALTVAEILRPVLAQSVR
jgi:tetratricopeptide (TPR) repeat protein